MGECAGLIPRPLIKYYGSKFGMAKYYPAPKYPVIYGVCAGGAGYEHRHNEHQVILCDINQDLINLWEWLIFSTVPEDLPTTELIQGQDLRALNLPGCAADLIRRWQRLGKNDCWTVSKWNCANAGFWSPATLRAIRKNQELIRHWRTQCCSYEELPDVEATWFVDPMYQHQPASIYGCKPHDYRHLGEWCMSRKGQVIVCEQEGADWLPFVPLARKIGGARSHGGKHYTEVVCIIENGIVKQQRQGELFR
jgi:hypothetical protein